MFNQQELQILLGGANTPIDVNDLRRNTVYGGSFNDDEPTILAFWKVRTGQEKPFSPVCSFFGMKAHFFYFRSLRVSTLNNAKHCYDSSQVSEGPLFCTYPPILYSRNSSVRLLVAALVAFTPSFRFDPQERTKIACRQRAPA